MSKRKLSFDGWLLIAIFVLIIIIIIEAIIINKTIKEKEAKNVIEEDSNFILYKGCEIAGTPGSQNPLEFSVGLDESSNKKYNTTYYNYENGLYKGETQGEFKFESDGNNQVKNVSKVAMTKKFNAIPRAYERLEKVPSEILKELKDYETVEADLIDIDGDGTKEYFVSVKSIKTENGKNSVYSAIMLYSHDYAHISDLVIIDNGILESGETKSAKKLTEEDYAVVDLDSIEYIDLNDDNIMEVLIDVPQQEGMLLSVFNYSGYQVYGEKTIIDSIMP